MKSPIIRPEDLRITANPSPSPAASIVVQAIFRSRVARTSASDRGPQGIQRTSSASLCNARRPSKSPGSYARSSSRSVSIGMIGTFGLADLDMISLSAPPPVNLRALSCATAMATSGPSEYVYSMQGVSRTHPPDKQVLDGHLAELLSRARRSASSATTAPASRRCCGSWPASTTTTAARRGSIPNATVGMLEQEPQLDDDQGRARQRRGRRRRAARHARPLQRARRQLLRRDRRRVRPPAGPDRRGRRLEPRHDPRDGDGRAAPAAGRRRRHQALRRRAAPGRALPAAAQRPDLLLLDEPTNHLDAESVAWLEQHLEDYKGTVVAVTHDRYFLDNVAGWILELDRGRGIPFKGNYSSWLEQKQERLAHEERKESARQRTLAAELEWIRENPKGRRKKSKARLDPLRGAAGRGAERQARRRSRSTSRPARGSATSSSRPRA